MNTTDKHSLAYKYMALKSHRIIICLFTFAFLLLHTQLGHADNSNLSQGYYRIISAGNGQGYSGGPYNYENKIAWYCSDGIVKWTLYDPNNYSMIFKLIPDGDNWYIYNLRDESYVAQGESSFKCNVTTSKTGVDQTITTASDGKYIIRATSANHVYSINASHNGSSNASGSLDVWGTEQEAKTYGINVWYISPVSEEVVNFLKENEVLTTYSISETAEEPRPGKKYVVKNASADYYMTASAGLTTTADAEPEYFWEIEQSGNSVDSHPTYYIKSVSNQAYWQYVDYSSKDWNGTSPYDGYDWYDYAGMNAEFGPKSGAMEVTILASGSTNSWRSAGATDGYVVAMKDVVSFASKNYYYKLGTQNNNVAMEPWEENVRWLFYPVTSSNDILSELESALQTYGKIDTTQVTGTDPGYISSTRMHAYKDALLTAESCTISTSNSIIRSAINNLKSAYNLAEERNPIHEGYFYIVTAGNGTGYYTGSTPPEIKYNNEWKYALYNADEMVSWKSYDPVGFEQIYYLTSDGYGDWYMQSAFNGDYIDKGNSTYNTNIHTSPTPITAQTFTLVSDGKFTIRFKENPYVYSLAASHNGSNNEEGHLNIWGSTKEAEKFGVNVWYVKQVPDSVIENFSKTNAGLNSICNQYDALANGLAVNDAPGYYNQSKVNALKEAIAQARIMAQQTLTNEQRESIAMQLKQTYNDALEINPITNGYYYIRNNYTAYNRMYGSYPAIYTATSMPLGSNGSACYYTTFDPQNANFIYKVEKSSRQDYFSIQNAYTSWFLNTGESNTQNNELFTCSPSLDNTQILKWHSVGQFCMTDSTDSTSLHVISNPSALNKCSFIQGGPEYGAEIPSALTGYNTWSLIPISENEAMQIIAAQTTRDQQTANAYSQMVDYHTSIANDYNAITTDNTGKYNTDAVIALRTMDNAILSLISSRKYDITSTQEDYNAATLALQAAMQTALTAKPDTTSAIQLSGTPIGATSVDYTTSLASTTVNTPPNTFDGDFSTIYASYERSTGWVGLDLGSPHVINKVSYAPRANYASRMVLGVFEGANKPDFSDAIPFYVIKTAPQYDILTTAKVECSRGFRYVRYVGPNNSRTNISELRFYGTQGVGDDSHLYQLTNLPLVVIRTEVNIPEIISKSTWLPGNINIISHNGTALKTDSMNVRGRGNGSWSFEKKPYKIKLANKSRILDMPAKAKEWTLINNYGDKSLIRNNVAFKISDIFEMDYTPACTLVDVIFNGQYKGSYQMCDQVEVNENRVNVTKMTTNDNAGDSLTGGYLIEIDAYAGGEPKHFTSSSYSIPVTVHYPKSDEITSEQFDYIVRAFNDLCHRVYSSNYKSDSIGYATVLAEDTWLKYFLIQELIGNTDAYWSVYLSKDRNDKFRVNPIWDLDLAFDNDKRTHPILTMSGFLSYSSKSSAANGVRSFNRKIIESCSKELKELWSWYRYRGNLNYGYIKAAVDSLGQENNLSQEYNYIRWDILNTCTQQQYTTRGSYKAEVEFINEYIYDRITWLDNIVGLEEPIGIHSAEEALPRGGIHGHDGYILIRGFAEGSTAQIYNVSGIEVSSVGIEDFDNHISLPKGIYIVKVTDAQGKHITQKVAVK